MISVIIPAYNEEANLSSLLDSLVELRKKQNWSCEIIVVNDNSKDRTPVIADEYSKKYAFIKTIHRKKRKNGMGYALIEGTKHAKGEFVIWTMGDKSDDINVCPKMIEKLKSGYDLVFGSRYMKGGSKGDLDLFKASLSSGYTLLCRIIFGIPVHDITNAFRCFRREVFNNISLIAGEFATSPEFAIKAHLAGFKLGEVPTKHKDRIAGKAKFKMLKMSISYISLLKYRFIIKKSYKH